MTHVHRITQRLIEDGRGHLPLVHQFHAHVEDIAAVEGRESANKISMLLEEHEPEWKAHMDGVRHRAAEHARKAEEEASHQERTKRALALLDEHEAAEAAQKEAI